MELVNGTPFNILRADRSAFARQKKKGGGLIVLVRDNIPAEAIQLLEDNQRTQLEWICVKITVDGEVLLILNVYSAPCGRSFGMGDLSKVVNGMVQQGKMEWILLGDFNQTGVRWIPSVRWEMDSICSIYLISMFILNTLKHLTVAISNKLRRNK